MPPCYLYLDLPEHVMTNVSRFGLHTLSLWNPPFGAADVDIVTSATVLLNVLSE